MGDFEGFWLAIFLVAAIAIFVLIIYAFWSVAGFICGTLGWNQPFAQLFTALVMLAFTSYGTTKRKE